MNRQLNRDIFGIDCTPEEELRAKANTGGVLYWLLIIPVSMVAGFAYFYGISW